VRSTNHLGVHVHLRADAQVRVLETLLLGILGRVRRHWKLQAALPDIPDAVAHVVLDVLNRGTAIYEDQALQFKRRLEISQQIIRANDEEAQAIDRLTKAYPALSRGALRELYEAEKKVADIRQKKNEVTAQGLNLEQAAARAASGTAGALGFGAGQNQGPQANQGAGAAGGGSVKGGNVININLNGTEVTPDQVVRALRRAEALGR